jgi:hypothetical protein
MKYAPVKRPHVVPRSYLSNFAVEGVVTMWLVREPGARTVPVSKAGVLKGFYRRERPDGTPIYDVEWSLAQIERVAPPIMRGISDRWPLTLEEKAILAEFIGVQMLRGSRWRNWHSAFTNDYIGDVALSGEFDGMQPEGMTVDQGVAEARRLLTSNTAALVKMIELSRKFSQVLASMHWTLLEFARPLLVTSDHPVVTWPMAARSRRPSKSDRLFEGGILNTLEVRFPVSSRHAILMTWLDLPDALAPIARPGREIAANLNAFTVCDAEHQWFHTPGPAPPKSDGQLLALAPRLHRGYCAGVAAVTFRRGETSRLIQAKIGDSSLVSSMEIVTIGRAGEGGSAPVRPR